jgi:mannose-6-phosphate isomerase
MENAIREYDWGSTTTLAQLQGRRPTGRPEAELWVGAHPVAASRLIRPDGVRIGLGEAIEADPDGLLGASCTGRFGPRLPFLLKVLAVERALSIQVHPTREQAAEGYAAEEESGVPAGRRSYVDPYAKPEMLVAVTPFVALAGLRDAAAAARLLGLLDLAALRPLVDALVSGVGDGRRVTAEILITLATWPNSERQALSAAVSGRVGQLLTGAAAADGPAGPDGLAGPDGPDPGDRADLEWVQALAGQHPNDPMMLAPLILQVQRLAPGRAMFLPAGVPHAYLSGTGVELMGSSDNVVRAGLTHKRVDSALLATLLDPVAEVAVDVPWTRIGATEQLCGTDVIEFALSRLVTDGKPVVLAGAWSGPQVLLCMAGEVSVAAGGRQLTIGPGQSAFLPPSTSPVVLLGAADVFRAGVGKRGVGKR